MAVLITEHWLRQSGWKWHEVERSGRHWLLWIGGVAESCHGGHSSDDLGVELVESDNRWMLFVRADYAGRYSRFLFIREVSTVEQVTQLIEAMTGQAWDAGCVWYGCLRRPDVAEHLRAEADRLDKVRARHAGQAIERDRDRPHIDDDAYDARREAIERLERG